MIPKPQPAKQAAAEQTVIPSPSDQDAAEEMLRRLHENLAADPTMIEPLIHPQAEMRLLVSYGRPLRGRAAIINALERGREAAMYRAEVTEIEWLDQHTALTSAHARYALEHGGFAEGKVYWLDEFRCGLIWRVQVFKHTAEARKAHADHSSASVYPSQIALNELPRRRREV